MGASGFRVPDQFGLGRRASGSSDRRFGLQVRLRLRAAMTIVMAVSCYYCYEYHDYSDPWGVFETST